MSRTARVTAFAIVVLFTATIAIAQPAPTAPPAACESLARLALPAATITVAETIAAGAFHPPPADPNGPSAPARTYAALPAFCRVVATLTPSSDSRIGIEVWLPAADWNGTFEGVGNGGWSGAIEYSELAGGLRRGYATASTDTGHLGPGDDASFALGHPEKLIDFASRAVHEMTVAGKAIAVAYYGRAPRSSYWYGCSSGGRQGLKEAQRFPADYDGIMSMAPANNWTPMLTASVNTLLKLRNAPLSREKLATIHKAVLDSCDKLDGVSDGVIENPAACHFDPATLTCAAGDQPGCLTRQEVASVKALYGDTANPRTGERLFPGFAAGSELGWTPMAGAGEPFPIPISYFKFVVFKDAAWDFRQFDLARDLPRAEEADRVGITTTDADLKPYFDRGGKLLLVHGWSDQLISPLNSIDYYTRVQTAVGSAAAARSMRLFMVPGMMHCGGGPGPSVFDAGGALAEWVEHDRAPERIAASHTTAGKVDRTRPLCAYPQVATYTGTGSTDDAASFVCAAPK